MSPRQVAWRQPLLRLEVLEQTLKVDVVKQRHIVRVASLPIVCVRMPELCKIVMRVMVVSRGRQAHTVSVAVSALVEVKARLRHLH